MLGSPFFLEAAGRIEGFKCKQKKRSVNSAFFAVSWDGHTQVTQVLLLKLKKKKNTRAVLTICCSPDFRVQERTECVKD